jgi:hypothetical protein
MAVCNNSQRVMYQLHRITLVYIYKFGNNDGYITFGSTFPNNREAVMLAGGFGNLNAISIVFRSLAVELSF